MRSDNNIVVATIEKIDATLQDEETAIACLELATKKLREGRFPVGTPIDGIVARSALSIAAHKELISMLRQQRKSLVASNPSTVKQPVGLVGNLA